MTGLLQGVQVYHQDKIWPLLAAEKSHHHRIWHTLFGDTIFCVYCRLGKVLKALLYPVCSYLISSFHHRRRWQAGGAQVNFSCNQIMLPHHHPCFLLIIRRTCLLTRVQFSSCVFYTRFPRILVTCSPRVLITCFPRVPAQLCSSIPESLSMNSTWVKGKWPTRPFSSPSHWPVLLILVTCKKKEAMKLTH